VHGRVIAPEATAGEYIHTRVEFSTGPIFGAAEVAVTLRGPVAPTHPVETTQRSSVGPVSTGVLSVAFRRRDTLALLADLVESTVDRQGTSTDARDTGTWQSGRRRQTVIGFETGLRRKLFQVGTQLHTPKRVRWPRTRVRINGGEVRDIRFKTGTIIQFDQPNSPAIQPLGGVIIKGVPPNVLFVDLVRHLGDGEFDRYGVPRRDLKPSASQRVEQANLAPSQNIRGPEVLVVGTLSGDSSPTRAIVGIQRHDLCAKYAGKGLARVVVHKSAFRPGQCDSVAFSAWAEIDSSSLRYIEMHCAPEEKCWEMHDVAAGG